MKILVIQQKMIGDVLVSSIICNNLRKAYPEATIDYLVNDNTTPVLEGNRAIDNIILFGQGPQKSFIELLKFAMTIRENKYDLVIDAYSKLQSWVITLLSGAKRKISYKKSGRTFLYTDNVPMAAFPESNLGLAIERRLSLLSPLDLKIEKEVQPRLFVTEKEKKEAEELFRKHNVRPDRKTIMISLLGSEEIKTYPLAYMAKLLNFIGENYDVNILFNYFPKQLEQAKTVLSLCTEKTKEKVYFDLLGNDLRSFIGIMDRCDIIFGNDGGSINMAKALGKGSFIIFSPWIEKKIWATFEDGIRHTSIHLNDFRPELFTEKSYHDLKKLSLPLYSEFLPELISPKLKAFIDMNLNNQQTA
ncbi:glycosyltransferase family 9 protein [Flavobacterium sp. PLA-1-15]|uniref:glycosyltransferase family 9 protein n=1 Tax=Flavobacterium sp. PLA-1-15 TaxID=3380533 RepID=UPI003B75D924